MEIFGPVLRNLFFVRFCWGVDKAWCRKPTPPERLEEELKVLGNWLWLVLWRPAIQKKPVSLEMENALIEIPLVQIAGFCVNLEAMCQCSA